MLPPRILLATLTVAFPLVITACSDDATPDPGPPPPPIDAADFMASYTKTLCDHASRCTPAAAYIESDCGNSVLQTFGEDVQVAIESGKIVYDADAAGACIAGLEEMDCLAEQPSDATLSSCLSALKGTIAPGQPCFGTFECAGDICPSVMSDNCPTVCPTIAQKGEACSLLGGPDCDSRKGLRCSQGICVVPAGKGGACQDNFGCASGFVCVTNICVPLRGVQQGCAKDSSCQPGLYCASGGDEGGACYPRLDVGKPCGGTEAEYANAAFRGVQCKDGLVCELAELQADGTSLGGICSVPRDIGGNCTVWPPGVQLFETGCKLGLVCNAGKCANPPTSGEACATGFTCMGTEAYCDATTTTCMTLKVNGDACAADYECTGGICGSMGTCADRVTFCGN